ncbi:MAG: signal peptide peptidase SppA [Alphaproteobacteria bacterium]|nr:signal peptide peptidase SppA [Alphaproteobacteria bacterium]
MTLDVETVIDRRRLRRKITTWRVLAVVAALLAVGFLISANDGATGFLAPKQIARVSFTGTILEDRAQLKMLDDLAKADNVEAVVVYVNSPGGTTTGGEAIYESLRRIAETKPVVAQFGTVAASAGYIVGLASDHIVARGNTITGSVGVIVQWPQVTELLEKIGVEMKTVKSGVLKAEPSPFSVASPEALQATEEMIEDSFSWFRNLVETRRGINISDIPGLREGRIFSGRQAKGHRLVDQIGGEREVRAWLETQRGIEADLKIVDWRPADPGAWGFSAMAAGIARSIAVGGAAGFAEALTSAGNSLLSLDGLVSVWHPRES